jgi:hypothetical protein
MAIELGLDLLLLKRLLTILVLIGFEYNFDYIFTSRNPIVSTNLLFSIQIVILAIDCVFYFLLASNVTRAYKDINTNQNI